MDPLANEHVRTLPPRVALPDAPPGVARLDLCEFPYPPSPRVAEAIRDAAASVNRYPDSQARGLRAALATYTGVAPEQIFAGNGSDDLIELLVKVFAGPGDEVLIPVPSFFQYGHAAQVLGARPVLVPRAADFAVDVPRLLDRVTARTRLIFLATPNNPTGNLLPRGDLLAVLRGFRGVVVADECYFEFCGATAVDLLGAHPRLVILRSLSKSFGLAGLRVGYALASPGVTEALARAAQPFAVNRLAQAAAVAALADPEYARSRIAELLHERDALKTGLERLGLVVNPSAANFLFASTARRGGTSAELTAHLRERGVLVRDFGNKPGTDATWVRLGLGTPAENRRLLQALAGPG